MRHLRIVFGFIPWFVFYALNNNTPKSIFHASIIAVLIIILLDKEELKQRFVLPCTSLIFFVILAIIAKLDISTLVMDHARALLNLALPVVIWLSLLIGKPFTLQYAKQQVDKSRWSSPIFIKINWLLSGMWAILISISSLPYVLLTQETLLNSWFWSYAFAIICIVTAILLNQRIPKLIISHNFWNTVKKLPPVDSPFLKNGFAPVKEELTLNNLAIDGQIPQDLNGKYLRNGPNPYFTPYTYTYPIDGDGMIHQITLNNNQAQYRNRFVKTKALVAERKAGIALYAGIQCPIPPDPHLTAEELKNTAAVHIIPWGENLLALYETATAYVLDQELNTLGEWTPVANKKFLVNAHYRTDPITKHSYMFTYNLEMDKPPLEIYHFNEKQQLQNTIPILKPRINMIHDLIITQNYIIVFDCPAFFNPDFNPDGKVKQFFGYEPASKSSIILIHKTTYIISFLHDLPAFWVYHFVNAYEENHKIHIDFVYHDRLALNSEVSSTPRLYHGEINPETLSYSHYELFDHAVEFPSYNLNYTGQKYRYGYLATKTTSNIQEFDSILKYDFQKHSPKIIQFGENIEVGETVFVAKSNPMAEDDGYLMLFVYNKITDKSDFIILEANDDNNILARIHLPVRVPHGLHGSWINSHM